MLYKIMFALLFPLYIFGSQEFPLYFIPDQTVNDTKIFTLKAEGMKQIPYAKMKGTRVDGSMISFDVAIDSEGFVMLDKKRMYFGGSYGMGEWLDIAIIPTDKKGNILNRMTAKGRFLPHPLTVTHEGRTIELQPSDSSGKVFLLKGQGFEPCEEVKLISRSCHEVLEGFIKAGIDGQVHTVYLTGVKGYREGSFEISLLGKKMSKPIVIQHYWGNLAFTPAEKYDSLKKLYPVGR